MKQFYLSKDGQNYGPMTVEQMLQYGVDANSLVWTDGMQDWTPAGQVAEFKPYFAQPRPNHQPEPQPEAQQPEPQSQQTQPSKHTLSNKQENEKEPLTKSQQVFKGFLFFPIFLTILIGLGLSIGFISLSSKLNFSSLGINTPITIIILWSITIMTIGVYSFIKMIKGRGYGLITIVFFLITLIFFLIMIAHLFISVHNGAIHLSLNRSKILKISTIIFSILGIISFILASFAAVPIEKIGNGKSYKKLLTESSLLDYILLGLYLIFSIIILVRFLQFSSGA